MDFQFGKAVSGKTAPSRLTSPKCLVLITGTTSKLATQPLPCREPTCRHNTYISSAICRDSNAKCGAKIRSRYLISWSHRWQCHYVTPTSPKAPYMHYEDKSKSGYLTHANFTGPYVEKVAPSPMPSKRSVVPIRGTEKEVPN